jgi:hypothetical protein
LEYVPVSGHFVPTSMAPKASSTVTCCTCRHLEVVAMLPDERAYHVDQITKALFAAQITHSATTTAIGRALLAPLLVDGADEEDRREVGVAMVRAGLELCGQDGAAFKLQ